ncbi:MAG: hypothetical protein AMXMBFR52_14810 [Burkholderiales bacterium]|jgi:prevent-host-death family protein
MREITAFEAKNKLGTVLDWVESGEEVLITRHGKTVARMVPAQPVDRDGARKAAANIRKRSVGVALGDLEIEELIDEGRP